MGKISLIVLIGVVVGVVVTLINGDSLSSSIGMLAGYAIGTIVCKKGA